MGRRYHLSPARKERSRFAPGLNNLGVALERKGYWPLAVLTYQDALEIDPQLAAAQCNLGEIQAGSGSLDEAIDHYRQALRSDPDCARAHHLLGIALVAKGRFEEADDDYPESVKPLNQFRGPALDEAMACYKQAQNCYPTWTPARNTLRIPLQDQARLKEAIDHYRQAVRIEPYFAWCHGALGRRCSPGMSSPRPRSRSGGVSIWSPRGKSSMLTWNVNCSAASACALECRLPAVVQGKDRPAAADCHDLAELCLVQKQYATAARLYAEALADIPN